MKLIIHAGLHKTGTSALQNFFHNNRKLLYQEYNIYYPPTEPFEAHHNFAARLRKHKSVLEATTEIKSYVEMIFGNIGNCHTLLLSSEMFSEQLNPVYLKEFTNLFDSVNIFFYVRRQDELSESAYNQQVKQNNETRFIHEFQPYTENLYGHLNWFKESLNNNAVVHARVYDKILMEHSNIYEDFSTHVLSITDISKFTVTKSLINPSFSVPAVQIKTYLNRLDLDGALIREVDHILMLDMAGKDYTKYKLLSDADELNIFARNFNSNVLLDRDYLNAKYFQTLTPRSEKVYCDLSQSLIIAESIGVLEKISNIAKVNF